jgi:hypothetical protein
MRFEYEDDDEQGFLDIVLSKKDLMSLLDEDLCESASPYRHKELLKKKVNITIRKEFEDAPQERQEP